MSKVVANVVKNAVLDIFSSKTVDVNLLRTQRDVPTSWIGAGILLCTVLFAAYFHFMYAEKLRINNCSVLNRSYYVFPIVCSGD